MIFTSLSSFRPSIKIVDFNSGVTRWRRGTTPGDTLQGGDTGRKFFLWANLQRIVEKRGRTGKKKVWGDTLEGVTPE